MKPFTEHPQFMNAGAAANNALAGALRDMGCEEHHLFNLEDRSNRVVDDLTRLLLAAFDAKTKREGKGR